MSGPDITQIRVSTGNELDKNGKIIAAILLIVFTVLPLIMIIAFWPDRIPGPIEKSPMIYEWNWFNLKLADELIVGRSYMHLNSILFSLVAFAGFLGSMIHVGSSFTNFIGSETLKKSWILWYLIKPFTGTATAILIYLVLRAGLLNFGDSSNVNVFGVVTIAAFAGLFTDKATIKLEEVFSVMFRPSDERPDKIQSTTGNLKISGIKPEEISGGKNDLMISGEGLDKNKLILKINGIEVSNPLVKSNSISFSYLLPDDQAESTSATIQVFDENGKEIFIKNVLVKKENGPKLMVQDDDLDVIAEGVTEEDVEPIKG